LAVTEWRLRRWCLWFLALMTAIRKLLDDTRVGQFGSIQLKTDLKEKQTYYCQIKSTWEMFVKNKPVGKRYRSDAKSYVRRGKETASR